MDEQNEQRIGVVLCDERAAQCRCREPKGHEPPHRCHPDCGGAWNGRENDGTFDPVAWPLPSPVPGLRFDEEW
jgi:hypothetical protein